MKKSVIHFDRPPTIIASASVVGAQEKKGPLGDSFDLYDESDRFGMNTWEKSESEMQRMALSAAITEAGLHPSEIDLLFAGDLLNQCVGSSFGLLSFEIPYCGLYGACSTAAESLLLSSIAYSAGAAELCAAVSSSHNCSAERQFRFPVEYGGQRAPTAQWTVTGAGAFLLGAGGRIEVVDVMVGRMVDRGISDVNNMGAAMAPAAIDTLTRYFRETGRAPESFDMIVTGDLGREGSGILCDLLLGEGYDIRKNHVDCGKMIYHIDEADMHAGGSGCGCSAVVLASHLLKLMESGTIGDILFLGTGALMSTMSLQQGNAIPGIAHLVHLKTKGEGGEQA